MTQCELFFLFFNIFFCSWLTYRITCNTRSVKPAFLFLFYFLMLYRIMTTLKYHKPFQILFLWVALKLSFLCECKQRVFFFSSPYLVSSKKVYLEIRYKVSTGFKARIKRFFCFFLNTVEGHPKQKKQTKTNSAYKVTTEFFIRCSYYKKNEKKKA